VRFVTASGVSRSLESRGPLHTNDRCSESVRGAALSVPFLNTKVLRSVWLKVKLLLCSTKYYAVKTYWGMEVWLHPFLTSALDGGCNNIFERYPKCLIQYTNFM